MYVVDSTPLIGQPRIRGDISGFEKCRNNQKNVHFRVHFRMSGKTAGSEKLRQKNADGFTLLYDR